MARQPGEPAPRPIVPDRIPLIGPTRASIAGVEKAANAIAGFEARRASSNANRESNEALASLHAEINEYSVEVEQNPANIDGVISGFDDRFQGRVDALASTIRLDRHADDFRNRAGRALESTPATCRCASFHEPARAFPQWHEFANGRSYRFWLVEYPQNYFLQQSCDSSGNQFPTG